MSSRNIIEKHLASLEDWDKDERYMGTSDLCNELQKDIKMDPMMELRVCTAILKRLDDTSNDVQSKAIQCLAILFKKVQPAQVFEICDKLCSLLLTGNDELRDIYSIGLKTLVTDVPEESGRGVAQRLINRLLSGVQGDKLAVKLECLDCLADLMKRFGHEVGSEHSAAVAALLEQLASPASKKAVQKKATTCLGATAVVLSEPLLNELVESLLASAQSSDTDSRVIITAIGQVSRSVGYRMGKHLDAIVPLFLKFLGEPADEALQNDATSELRETCLQGFESCVLRSPREVAPHLGKVSGAAVAFMKYDPNYCDDDDEADEDGSDEDFDEDYDDDGDDDEDDDTSWKVRRAAVKVLAAAASQARPDALASFYGTAALEVANRFKEREENVRVDVIECAATLVRSTRLAAAAAPEAVAALGGNGPLLPQLMAQSLKVLGGKANEKSKSAVLNLLKQLVTVLPGPSLQPYVEKLVGVLGTTLKATGKATSAALKLDALTFLRQLLLCDSPELCASLQPHLPTLLPLALATTSEDWYKLVAEALRVVSALVQALRPLPYCDASSDGLDGDVDGSGDVAMGEASTATSEVSSAVVALVAPLLAALKPRLEAHDIDQEIKEGAIGLSGQVLASLGDVLPPTDKQAVLTLLAEKLKNEITRMPALKALSAAARSPLKLDLGTVLPPAVGDLAMFLRQQSRPLKQTTLETLMALVPASRHSSESSALPSELLAQVLTECAPLVNSGDLFLSHLALQLTCLVLPQLPPGGAAGALQASVLPPALQLCGSSLVQGRALASLLRLLRDLVRLNAAGASFEDLYASLRRQAESYGSGSSAPPKQAVANLGRGLACLCIYAPDMERQATVNALLQDLQPSASAGNSDVNRTLALLTLGEIGQHKDLSAVSGLQALVHGGFEATAEDTKSAAAFCLGGLAVGAMATSLPPILDALLTSPKHHYLLLAALKEVIAAHAQPTSAATNPRDFAPYLDSVLAPLLQHCRSPEEGVRTMVAECLGALLSLRPDVLVPRLVALCDEGRAAAQASDEATQEGGILVRWTVAASLKHAMRAVQDPDQCSASLKPHLAHFLVGGLASGEDLTVIHATLQLCNAAVHHQPKLATPFLSDPILPALLNVVTLKVERMVDLGPFKQKVDDGLPLRKAALAALSTILDVAPEHVDMATLALPLSAALDDVADVQQICHQVVVKVAASPLHQSGVRASLDLLAEPLRVLVDKTLKSIAKKLKEGTGGPEMERQNDLVRSALRAYLALDAAADEDATAAAPKFRGLKEIVAANERLCATVEQIKTEG